MQDLWVVLEDEYPALYPAPGDEVELSCRWMPRPTFVPQSIWTPGDSLRTEPVDRGTRVYSDFSQFEAVIAPAEDLSGAALSGIAELDRYLWINTDYLPSFRATTLERAIVTSEGGDWMSPSKHFTTDSKPPAGHLILHRLARVRVHPLSDVGPLAHS